MKIIRFETIDSTNNYLKSHYKELAGDLPVMVTSAEQTGGRGREQRTWLSTRGKGLYTSFGFCIENRSNLVLLPLCTGIAAIRAVHTIGGIRAGLKWPNDILDIESRKKIGGILIENTITEDSLFCIVGIGLNLNHTAADFPPGLIDRAASIKMLSGAKKEYEIEKANTVLTEMLFPWIQKLEQGKKDEIIDTARACSDFLMNKTIRLHQLTDGTVTEGIFKGIDDNGGLILQTGENQQYIYYSGEILE